MLRLLGFVEDVCFRLSFHSFKWFASSIIARPQYSVYFIIHQEILDFEVVNFIFRRFCDFEVVNFVQKGIRKMHPSSGIGPITMRRLTRASTLLPQNLKTTLSQLIAQRNEQLAGRFMA